MEEEKGVNDVKSFNSPAFLCYVWPGGPAFIIKKIKKIPNPYHLICLNSNYFRL